MATYSTQERTSHVIRRLGFGAQPDLVLTAAGPDEAIAAMLDRSTPQVEPPELAPPLTEDAIRSREQVGEIVRFWLEQLIAGPDRLQERMVWFWHDHFPSDIRRVNVPYLMWTQHLTLRRHATGSFAELLHAIAVDPAMLVYLDGASNAAGSINENFGREVMELFTVGRGAYTEADVVAAARAFSGWVVKNPLGRAARLLPDVEPWAAAFVPFRHDRGDKTLLGATGAHDAAAAIDILLDHPATAERVAAKLYEELVGLPPDPATTARLGVQFRRDYDILTLVGEIVADPVFVSDEAIRTRVRTPLEQAVGTVQAFGLASDHGGRALVHFLETVGYVPMRPPNVAGFPSGHRLLDPYTLTHTFDLAGAVPDDVGMAPGTELMARLGIFDLDLTTLGVLDSSPPGSARLALALNAPEYHVT